VSVSEADTVAVTVVRSATESTGSSEPGGSSSQPLRNVISVPGPSNPAPSVRRRQLPRRQPPRRLPPRLWLRRHPLRRHRPPHPRLPRHRLPRQPIPRPLPPHPRLPRRPWMAAGSSFRRGWWTSSRRRSTARAWSAGCRWSVAAGSSPPARRTRRPRTATAISPRAALTARPTLAPTPSAPTMRAPTVRSPTARPATRPRTTRRPTPRTRSPRTALKTRQRTPPGTPAPRPSRPIPALHRVVARRGASGGEIGQVGLGHLELLDVQVRRGNPDGGNGASPWPRWPGLVARAGGGTPLWPCPGSSANRGALWR
jgi:hypothetical protein